MTIDVTSKEISEISRAAIEELLTDELQYLDVDAGDIELAPQADGTKTWARLTVTLGPIDQAAFVAGDSKRPYTFFGVAKIQVFAPKGEGTVASREIAMLWLTKLATQRLSNGTWFKNGKLVPVGIDGNWYNYNASLEFQFVARV